LHAATDADKGGNSIAVRSHPYARNLHAAWDTAVVEALENNVGAGSPDATAHKREQQYASQKDADSWKQGAAGDVAWESNQLARTEIYQALRIPLESCYPEVNSCVDVPGGPVELDDAYMNKGPRLRANNSPKRDSDWPVC
jgi:S1/P1 Nuclease